MDRKFGQLAQYYIKTVFRVWEPEEFRQCAEDSAQAAFVTNFVTALDNSKN